MYKALKIQKFITSCPEVVVWFNSAKMEEALLYSKYNDLQKHDALSVIDDYLRLVKWKNSKEEAILDVGCGDGDVLLDILLPRLPQNFGKLVGVDLSEEMVKFARRRTLNGKIQFTAMDISTTEVPVEFQGEFDHVFSFYCLHWVSNQRQAMKNIFDMMKPGGDMLLAFLSTNPIFHVWETMSKTHRWSAHMQSINKYISPYHNVSSPDRVVDKILRESGFTGYSCRVLNRSYTYPSMAILSKSITAVNPFSKKFTQGDNDDFVRDYIKELRKLKAVTIENCNNNKNDERFHFDYKLLVVFASKPL